MAAAPSGAKPSRRMPAPAFEARLCVNMNACRYEECARGRTRWSRGWARHMDRAVAPPATAASIDGEQAMTDPKRTAHTGPARSGSWASIDPETGGPRTTAAVDEGTPAGAAARPAQPFSPGELMHLEGTPGADDTEEGRFTVTLERESSALYNPETGEAPAAARHQRWAVSARAARAIRRIAEEDAAR